MLCCAREKGEALHASLNILEVLKCMAAQQKRKVRRSTQNWPGVAKA